MILRFWKEYFNTFITPKFYGGGGGGGTTTSTNVTSNIPDWLKPQTQQMLAGATKQLFETDADGAITGIRPYTPYSTNVQDYYAGFSPMQQQAMAQASQMQMPGQYAQASDFANTAGYGGMQSADQALGYGQTGFESGQLGQRFGLQSAGQAQDMADFYGQAGYQAGLQGQDFALQSAKQAQDAADFYGQAGYQAGLQGQQSGLLGQQLGIEGGQRYGAMGAGYGQQAANLSGAAQGYGAMGAGYGQQAANLAGAAQGYGAAGASYGDLSSQLGLQGLQAQEYGMDVGQQARDYAAQAASVGGQYGRAITDPYVVAQYMSPYQSNVTEMQKTAALRDFQVAQQQRQANAARSGAYGGSRQAIENAEAQRNLNTALQSIDTQGLQSAYQQAIQNIAQQQTFGIQGLSGAQTGLNTALQGGQLGLSGLAQAISGQNAAMQGQQVGLGGVNAANQAYQTGIQGTQAGLQGVNAANQAYQTGIQGALAGLQGVDRQLAGTSQGMQGAQAAMQGAGVGLSGVGQGINAGNLGLSGIAQAMQGAGVGLSGVGQGINAGNLGLSGIAQGMQGAESGLKGVAGAQAGYGMAGQAGRDLSSIGNQQLAAQQNIIDTQYKYGAQQQAQEQKLIDAAIENYAAAQNAPMDALSQYNALIRGLGTTSKEYKPGASTGSQLAGLAATGIGAYQALKAKGGVVKAPKRYKSGGLVDLALANVMGNA